ncbi:ATP-dependent helicase HrpB [Vibrio gallicus]|uniref:ATP-dependent helicase HrpB n=1 Tax=Vibrio gallicus TaxID=190897 RepID=UPI0021C36D08|nr:ATP-dependent helicase HrpB [Vibrio gallicus]
MIQAQSSLPITEIIAPLIDALSSHNQFVIQAPPGAGKSTYLPLMLVKSGQVEGRIIMLEPRRLAAKSIATYLASQLGEPVGKSIGYRIRGESKSSQTTRLEIVTEGILTRMIQADPELTGVGMVVFDEYHERSLHADLGLALALEVQQVFNERLKIVVMSATLQHLGLDKLIPDAMTLESQGRSYAIEQRYAPAPANEHLVTHICRQTLRLLNKESGSALVFVPSVGLINACIERLSQDINLPQQVEVLALHGSLDFKAQQQAIQPAKEGYRKLVIATNIAETSLTIEGVRIVVDTGLENQSNFDLVSGVTKLEQKQISQSSAIQRAGRAGRTESGICVRLYSESLFNQSAFHTPPEIQRSDLSSLVLEVCGWGARRLDELQWLDIPSAAAEDAARQLLTQLTLLSSDHTLTQAGTRALQLGLEPRLAAILLRAPQSLLATAMACVAVVEEPLRNNEDLAGQVLQLVQGHHAYQRRLLTRIHSLSQKMAYRFDCKQVDLEQLGNCLSFGFPDRVAIKRNGGDNTYLLASGVGAFIDELSPLVKHDLLVVARVQKSRQADGRILLAAPILRDGLEQYHPLEQRESLIWDSNKQGMRGEKQLRLGALVIEKKVIPVADLDSQAITNGVLDFITEQGLQTLPWSDSASNLRTRVLCAKEWLPEMDWPDWSDESLIADLKQWLAPYIQSSRSLKDLQKLDLFKVLEAYLGWSVTQQLDQLLPTRLPVPTGGQKKLDYQLGMPPKLSIKLQEMFGQPSSPTVAQGRVKVTLELLSPAQRPLQVTQDLAGFWIGAYKEVQKEMKGRYPKHPWPDDPASHVATSKTKRQLNSK